MSAAYSDDDESDCCKTEHDQLEEKQTNQECQEGKQSRQACQEGKQTSQECQEEKQTSQECQERKDKVHEEDQDKQGLVYRIVHDHVEYDVVRLMERYEQTVRDIEESICGIFGVMLAYVKARKVFDTTFDFCGWMPRAQHAKLDSYKSLLNNLDGLVASFGSSTLELKALKMVAYSFHESYFEGLAQAFKEDLTCIRVRCAGLDWYFGRRIDQRMLDCILEDNTKWFLDKARLCVASSDTHRKFY